MKNLGEFELIDSIRKEFPAPKGYTGIGDDCAIIPQREDMDTLISTDMLVEGSHFLLEDVDPYHLGWKSAAVNISDIAAMGGRPIASFLSIALPPQIDQTFMQEFMRGYGDLSAKFHTALLGGDTTSSNGQLCINVTVVGECPHGQAIRRSGAKPGDLICVVGAAGLGESAAGLKVILDGLDRQDSLNRTLVESHYKPLPMVRQALALRGFATSMMDISDGIGSDLRHILEESGVGARVRISDIPLSDRLQEFCARHSLDPVKLALEGGEDYGLLFTMPETKLGLAQDNLAIGPFSVIGRITEEKDLVWEGSEQDYCGFRHF